jgi:hypothetical protein
LFNTTLWPFLQTRSLSVSKLSLYMEIFNGDLWMLLPCYVIIKSWYWKKYIV